jgi:DNA-binding beta-propeller fold protein YncE
LALVVALAALCTTAAPASAATFVRSWGSHGSGHGQFAYPFGVAVDAHGHVYVADNNNRRIEKFTADGAFLTAWGSYGSGQGQFSRPSGVAVDAHGHVYVADTSNNRIEKFSQP